MNERVRKLSEEIRKLPPEEQADLIEELLVLTYRKPDPEIEKAWAEEAKRRLDAYERGETSTAHPRRRDGSAKSALSAQGERIRQHRLNRFPYGIVYQVREDKIAILAVAHLHRRPSIGATELGRNDSPLCETLKRTPAAPSGRGRGSARARRACPRRC